MASLALFHNPATPVKSFSESPRRGIRVMNASQVSPVSSTVKNAALISDISAAQASSTVLSAPLNATPNRQYEPSTEIEEKTYPVAATAILNTDYARQIDPTYRGIKLDSEPSRIIRNTPESMERRGRVLDRTEVDPFTGKRVDYYRDQAPEENKDYRLPRETMNDVNRRLIAIQGYDHTKPKAQRTERLADAPQPDGRFDEAANYMRIMGEMQERASRDLVNNQKGERPAWMRETQRAFGYNGYQDMSRYVPDLPPTLRPDTKNLKPSMDQVNNPEPTKELKVRGAYREDAKTPHTGRVDWRNHAKSVDTDAMLFTGAMEQRVLDGTYRGEQEAEGFQPGPRTLDAAFPRIGDAHEARKKNMETNFALRATNTLTQSGAAAADATSQRVLSRILDSVGKQNAGARAVGAYASTTSSISSAPRLHRTTAGTDGSGTARPEYSQVPILDYASARESGINLPPLLLGSEDDQQEPKRLDFPQSQYRNYASATSTEMSNNGQTNINGRNEHLEPNRFFNQTEYFEPGALNFMGPKIADGVFEPAFKQAHEYSQEAGGRLTAAAADQLGSLQIGKQEILQVSGKRAETGNRSATSYLHGGGDGMAFREPGLFNREWFLPENNPTRGYTQDFTALRQAANRIMQPM